MPRTRDLIAIWSPMATPRLEEDTRGGSASSFSCFGITFLGAGRESTVRSESSSELSLENYFCHQMKWIEGISSILENHLISTV